MQLRAFFAASLFVASPAILSAQFDHHTVILSVTENTQGTQITVSGNNFGHDTPKVYLGATELTVTAHSESSITADLPAHTAAGSYLLGVDTGHWQGFVAFTAAVGEIGPAGAPGPQGPAGPMGPAGTMGATGAQGPIGQTGPAGPAGPMGQTGAAGPAGPIGPAGATGPAGPAGATGATGAQGPIGQTGPAGPAGPAGAPGPAGPIGPAGATGPAGPAGPSGAAGAQGAPGPGGPEGPAGPTGPQGPQGNLTSVFGQNSINFITEGNGGATCTLGSILLNASVIYTSNYLPADGRTLSIETDTALFSLIGTNYGGNGTTTFALPDLRKAAPNNTQYLICVSGIFP